MLIKQCKKTASTLLLPTENQSLYAKLEHQWFDIEFWKQNNNVTGSSRGRNITWFVAYNNEDWVLRHYYRGGLIGKLISDKYFFYGLKKTRCYQELKLLQQMHQQKLPVPKPIAARVIRQKWFYQADLLIEKIPHAQSLVQLLAKAPLEKTQWQKIGQMIAKFHQAGINHSDLNAHNILLDNKQTFWLIDFDKCQQQAIAKKWQQKNLARLKRSFNKELTLNSELNFNPQCWLWLTQGYQ